MVKDTKYLLEKVSLVNKNAISVLEKYKILKKKETPERN